MVKATACNPKCSSTLSRLRAACADTRTITVRLCLYNGIMANAATISLGICSDTHGEKLPTWPGRRLAAVLHAGDIYDSPTLVLPENYVNPRVWAAALGVPVLAVRGNHAFRDRAGFFMAAEDVSGRLVRIAEGLWVAGIGFAREWYCDTPGESDLEPQCHGLLRIAQRQVMPQDHMILLTHYPPKLPELPCDEASAGCVYGCVADLIGALRPGAVVFGHNHDWFGRQWRRSDGTLMVSPGPRGGVLTISANGETTFTPHDAQIS